MARKTSTLDLRFINKRIIIIKITRRTSTTQVWVTVVALIEKKGCSKPQDFNGRQSDSWRTSNPSAMILGLSAEYQNPKRDKKRS